MPFIQGNYSTGINAGAVLSAVLAFCFSEESVAGVFASVFVVSVFESVEFFGVGICIPELSMVKFSFKIICETGTILYPSF